MAIIEYYITQTFPCRIKSSILLIHAMQCLWFHQLKLLHVAFTEKESGKILIWTDFQFSNLILNLHVRVWRMQEGQLFTKATYLQALWFNFPSMNGLVVDLFYKSLDINFIFQQFLFGLEDLVTKILNMWCAFDSHFASRTLKCLAFYSCRVTTKRTM